MTIVAHNQSERRFVATLLPAGVSFEAAKALRQMPTCTWPEFVGHVRQGLTVERPTKEALPAIIPVRLDPERVGELVASGAYPVTNGTVAAGTLAMLDFDKVAPADFERVIRDLSQAPFASLVYASPNDPTPDGLRKFRVCVPLSRDLEPREIWIVRQSLSKALGLECDQSTKDARRCFFLGRLPNSPARATWETAGGPLDVDKLLALRLVDEPAAPPRVLADGPIIWSAGSEHEQAMTKPIVALLEDEYARGGRHKKARALGAVLAQAGWSDAGIAAIVGQLPSDTVDQRVEQAIDAAKLARAGERVHQLGALREVFGDRVAKLTVEAAKQPEIADLEAHATAAEAVASAMPRAEIRADLGNARRLVRLYGTNLRHCTARDMWLVWDGSRWREDETGDAMRLAKESAATLWNDARGETDDEKRKAGFAWAVQCQNAGRLEAAVKLAKTEPGIAVRVSELDADPWLLNVRNGTLDLRTGELRAPDRSLLMTKCCAADFSPGARSELWDRFIARTFGGDAELTAYVQRALGYALFGAWREKAFWFGYGPADGAKSTFFGIVGNVLGDYCMSAAASTWMVQSTSGGNRGDLVRLLGARLVTTSEIRESMRVDEENVKRVTGGDPIVAAAKYEGEIQFKPAFALWWFANDPPIIRDDDGAMWSRARVVPFTHVVPKAEQIKDLAERLSSPEHAPAVLAWLVEGCRAWQRDGLGTCAAVEQATSQYRVQMNRLARFVDECLEVTRDAADVVPARRMRERYEAWCRSAGVRAPLAPKAFACRLRELGAVGGDDASRQRINGQVDRLWSGVRLTDDAGAEFVTAVTGGATADPSEFLAGIAGAAR